MKRTLSRNEMRVVQRLADGKRLVRIATDMGVTYENVHSLLTRAFRKTGMHSQRAIVTLLNPTSEEENTLP
jgi:DNA-binding CsgD family transcriptional regulator